MNWKPGIYPNIDWDTYRAIPFISPSTLKKGLRSMRHLKRAIDGDIPQPSPDAVAVGQAVHCIIAGEEDRLAVMPDWHLMPENLTATGKVSTSKTTAFYKESKEAWLEENDSLSIMSEVQLNTAKKVVRELRANQEASQLFADSKHELTVIAEIEGVMCKTRIDGAVPTTKRVWDIKTTSDIEGRALYRQSKKMGYLFQFGFHLLACLGAGSNRFAIDRYDIIAAEVGGDYDTAVVEVPTQLLDDWATKVKRVLRDYREARESDCWPGLYDRGVGMLDVPDWDMAENGVFEG